MTSHRVFRTEAMRRYAESAEQPVGLMRLNRARLVALWTLVALGVALLTYFALRLAS
jgi:hypothetical protein